MNAHIGVSLFHIFLVVPFFLYVAIVRGQLEPWIFYILTGLGILLVVYHGYLSFVKYSNGSPTLWINLVHVIAVAPLLIFIGASGYDTPRWAYEILAMVAFAAGGYHLYSIVMEVQKLGNGTSFSKAKEAH